MKMILDDLTKKEHGFSDDGFCEDAIMIDKLTIEKQKRRNLEFFDIDIITEKEYNEETDSYEIRFKENDKCYISLYLTNRHFGGPEEGGWYYNTDHLSLTIPTLYNVNMIERVLHDVIKSRAELEIYGDIESVLGGQDGWIKIERIPGSSENLEHQTYC